MTTETLETGSDVITVRPNTYAIEITPSDPSKPQKYSATMDQMAKWGWCKVKEVFVCVNDDRVRKKHFIFMSPCDLIRECALLNGVCERNPIITWWCTRVIDGTPRTTVSFGSPVNNTTDFGIFDDPGTFIPKDFADRIIKACRSGNFSQFTVVKTTKNDLFYPLRVFGGRISGYWEEIEGIDIPNFKVRS